MKFTIITLFPEMFTGPFGHSIIHRAKEKGIVEINFVNPRDFATDKHKSVDDRPYGGGAGMIMKVDVIDRALKAVKRQPSDVCRIVLLDPRGQTYTQQKAHELTTIDHLVLLCGHYEGIDERIRTLVDEEISIGDYVLTGGEIPAMSIVDSITRLLPGSITHPEGTIEESFHGTLEYPQYTRPEEYRDMKVPEILLSGNHKNIEAWKTEQAQELTKKHRPDLLKAQTD